ncbi:MAG: MBL fold metallo-hydrolase [Traorella sp.]
MELTQISEHVFISSFEEERDRPILGYILGEKYSLAIDAGHSKEHVDEFYALLKQHHLPLPDYTILTHWHWDHSFGLHAIHGISFAEKRSYDHLQKIIDEWNEQSEDDFKKMDSSIALEYQNQKMIVQNSDIYFQDQICFDLGNLHVDCFHVESSHTDDATLILLKEEKLLFIGDSICGTYPDWKVDVDKMSIYFSKLESLSFDKAIGGHWEVMTNQELFDELIQEYHLR